MMASEVGDGSRTTREKLWFAAKIALGLLALAIVVALALLRTWPPLNVVMSGSMEPTIDTGDVVVMQRLDRPAEVGDIVKVRPPQDIQERLNYPDSVIHRIVEINDQGEVFTKGDARNKRDPFTVPLEDVNSHVVATVPAVGQIVAFFTSPLGLIWLVAGGVLFILIPYFELRRDQVALERAELGSIASLRLELQEIAQRVDFEARADRAPPAMDDADLEGEAFELADDEFAETEDLATELDEMRGRMDELVGAVGEYGEHLRSHTEVLKGMSAASQDLAATVAALRAALPAAAGAAAGPTDAERVLARWRLRRAEEVAGWMGFHDPGAAAHLATLDEATDDEGVEAALLALAAEQPHLRATKRR